MGKDINRQHLEEKTNRNIRKQNELLVFLTGGN